MTKTRSWSQIYYRLVLLLSLVVTLTACAKHQEIEPMMRSFCMVVNGQCKNPPAGRTCYCQLTGQNLP